MDCRDSDTTAAQAAIFLYNSNLVNVNVNVVAI